MRDLLQVVIITRFGIHMKDEEWYKHRYVVHRTFGQLCVMEQSNQKYDWIICLDKEPPSWFVKELTENIKYHTNIHLLHIQNDFIQEYRNYIDTHILKNSTKEIAMVRKDDDDAISHDFIETIYKEWEENHQPLFYMEPEPNQPTIKEWRGKWTLGDKVISLFENDKDILSHLFYWKKKDNSITIYFKNEFVYFIPHVNRWDDQDLEKLKVCVNTFRDKSFLPMGRIVNHAMGYQYIFKENQHALYKSRIPGTSVGLYSILPVSNGKLSQFKDCMYDDCHGHLRKHLTKGVSFTNYSNSETKYIFVRGLINDSVTEVKSSFCIEKPEYGLSSAIIKEFKINQEFLSEFIEQIQNTENSKVRFEKFKYMVDKNIKNLKTNTL